ncbi:MAG TPA: hypothetical protein VFP43_17860 [Mesorhizobium sp.]|nr:hypothetical protein [Mesorhizobium sp.]
MNAPIIPADTAIQAVALALSDDGVTTATAPEKPGETVCVVVDITLSYHALAGEAGI